MDYLKIAQIVIAVSLMISILLQNKGTGVSGLFGGGGGGNVYMTKRGLEQKLFVATIILSVLFFSISLVNVIM